MKPHIEHIRQIVETEPNDMIMGQMIRKYFNKVNTPEEIICLLCKKNIAEKGMSNLYSEPVCFDCANKEYHSRLDYDSFINKYHKDHALCPKCKHSQHTSTLVAYIYHADKPEEYKDLNKCICSHCKDRHLTHERVGI